MISGMLWFMRKYCIFLFMFVLTFNSFARENTLLDSGWKFQPGEVTNAEQAGLQRRQLADDFNSTQLGLGTGATGKGLLSRAGLVSARVEPYAGNRQTIFFAV